MNKKKEKQITEYLPLTESSFYILLTLTNELHGYGIMQQVEDLSKGIVTLGPGTLYGALTTMENEDLIMMVREEGRRKVYHLTSKGAEVLLSQINRYKIMLKNVKSYETDIKNLINNREEHHESEI